jgi:hypothetical protein
LAQVFCSWQQQALPDPTILDATAQSDADMFELTYPAAHWLANPAKLMAYVLHWLPA